MITPKFLFYSMMLSSAVFTVNAFFGTILGASLPNSIYFIYVLAASFLLFAVFFAMSFKTLEKNLKIVGIIYVLSSVGLASLMLMLASVQVPVDGTTPDETLIALGLLIYPLAAGLMASFYQTYFWTAIRAGMAVFGSLYLLGLSAILVVAPFIADLLVSLMPGFVFLAGSPAETMFIGIPGVIVSLIAYSKANKVAKAS